MCSYVEIFFEKANKTNIVDQALGEPIVVVYGKREDL
jgi:hypothetical protein